MNAKNTSDRDMIWLVGIHMVFVVSGLLMALTDKWTADATKPPKAPRVPQAPVEPPA